MQKSYNEESFSLRMETYQKNNGISQPQKAGKCLPLLKPDTLQSLLNIKINLYKNVNPTGSKMTLIHKSPTIFRKNRLIPSNQNKVILKVVFNINIGMSGYHPPNEEDRGASQSQDGYIKKRMSYCK